MKPEIRKRIIISYIVIGLLLLFNNLLLPHINNKKFSFDVFSSEICAAGEKKAVTDGAAGFLAFGPFIGCDRGTLRIEVFYSADAAGNTVDIYSNEQQQVFAKRELPEDRHKVTLETDLPVDLADTEFRVYYGGNGTLELNKLILSERIDDLYTIVIIYDIVLVLIGIAITVYTLRKKGKRT